MFNIRSYSPEVGNFQRRKTKLNMIAPNMNNVDVKQRTAWNIFLLIYPAPNKTKMGEC